MTTKSLTLLSLKEEIMFPLLFSLLWNTDRLMPQLALTECGRSNTVSLSSEGNKRQCSFHGPSVAIQAAHPPWGRHIVQKPRLPRVKASANSSTCGPSRWPSWTARCEGRWLWVIPMTATRSFWAITNSQLRPQTLWGRTHSSRWVLPGFLTHRMCKHEKKKRVFKILSYGVGFHPPMVTETWVFQNLFKIILH